MKKITAGFALAVLAFGVVGTPVQAAALIKGDLKVADESLRLKQSMSGDASIGEGMNNPGVSGSVVVGNTVYTADTEIETGTGIGYHSIIKHTLQGAYGGRLPYPFTSADGMIFSPWSLTVDGAGNLYTIARFSIFTEGSGRDNKQCIVKQSPTGALLGSYCNVFSSQGIGDGGLQYIAADQSGKLYAVTAKSEAEYILYTVELASNGSHRITELYRPLAGVRALSGGISLDENGTVYVSYVDVDESNPEDPLFAANMLRFEVGSSTPTVFLHDTDLQMIFASGVSSNGRASVIAFGDNGTTLRTYDEKGNFVAKIVDTGDMRLQHVAIGLRLGMDEHGAVYVRNAGIARIDKYVAPYDVALFASESDKVARLTLENASEASLIQASIIDRNTYDAPVDAGFDYPLGLVAYEAEVKSMAPIDVSYLVETDLAPNEVAVRKYNRITRKYAAVPDAKVTQSQVEGRPALLLEYQVSDGGPLDEDGTVNGTIVDPVGFAVAAGAAPVTPGADNGTANGGSAGTGSGASTVVPGAPNTGVGSIWSLQGIVLAMAAVAMIGVGLYTAWRRYRNVPLFSKK